MLDGDLAGFPNGRRLEDDIVDIDLRAFAQGYGAVPERRCSACPNKSPNNLLGDGVDANDKPFLTHVPVRRVAAPGLRGAITARRDSQDGGGAWPAGGPFRPG